MRYRTLQVIGALVWGSLVAVVVLPVEAQSGPSSSAADRERAWAMAERVDQALRSRWQAAGIDVAPVADDSEFLRRVYLDLTGSLPPVTVTRRFLADPRPGKRRELVDKLVHSPRFAAHMAAVWRRILVPRSLEPDQVPNAVGFERWLEQQFAARARFDHIVADLLTAEGDGTRGPALYYASLEAKPEKLAASTAANFLGLQIQCAECHDHPFDHWKQRDFWGYAAFFAQLQRPADNLPGNFVVADTDSGEVYLPGTDEVVPPRFLSGELAPNDGYGTRRARLAIWMASRDNPYLPRAAVNWAWFLLFNRGLVHPADDHGAHNPPSHPEVLDELTEFFIASGFDWSLLIQTLASTNAYQLSGKGPTDTVPPEAFARHLPRTLDAETLFDIILQVAGQNASPSASGINARILDANRIQFVLRMQAANSREPTRYERGVPQALLLMNGPLIDQLTSPQSSRLLQAVGAPFFSDEQRLEAVFLATLCRFPTETERRMCMNYIDQAADRSSALGDVLWGILNSAEFCLN
ncbi:MAG: hypothetical protein KatS3mg110_3661 [Pirellulaceae bacterium]|nr:MAG: hypothetical protein KatS3mg110_3661 [Pirellulaceae bacterium]